MSNHINHRTSTDIRPTYHGGTPTTVGAPAVGAPTSAPTPNHGRRRWMVPAGAVIGALLVVGAGVLVVDSTTDPAPSGPVDNGDSGASQQLVQESIDAALAEANQASSNAGTTNSYDVAEANRMNTLQDLSTEATPRSSQQLVQESIDAALAEANQASSNAGTTNSYDVAEANRMNTLQDLSTEATPRSSQQLVQESIDAALAEASAS